ncbi:DUF2617 family protein [Melissospora conviva]|uniref:DUF2617 family protein n=1 Tax=Melissospora conviva TaxID=3388432 RepID=UPI003B7B365C
MLVSLDTPYADTTAADLSLALDGPEQPALHVLECRLPGGATAVLRLLGASHQVLLRAGDRRISETVACLPGRTPQLPEQAGGHDGRYAFRAEVFRLDRAGLGARIAELRSTLDDDPYALVGVFPGDPDAVTALRLAPVDDGAVRWQTWHAYPQTGELVTTSTTVNLT